MGRVAALLLGLLLAPAAPAAPPLWTTLPPGGQPASCADFSRLIARARPAVVAVHTREREESAADSGAPLPYWPLFPEVPHRQRRGIGSGFIIRADGYIVTNHHVVAGAESITVRLADGARDVPARLVGSDERSDVALLKIDSSRPLPVLPLGRSETLPVGSWVVAIGNPFGLAAVATKGIVSGKGRSLDDLPAFRRGYFDFIQTDAAIDMGSSGGPLLNLRGEVVGINTAINARARGIGFAVPVDLAKAILPALLEHGRAERAYLGIRIERVEWEQARRNGLPETRGVQVTAVLEGGPAARAGMHPGDILVELGGRRIRGTGDVGWKVSTLPVGRPCRLVVLREGRRVELQLTPVARAGRKGPVQGGSTAVAGQALAGLDLAVVAQEGDAGHQAGLLVVAVAGQAAERGVRIGDVIVAVNDEPVSSGEQLQRLLAKIPAGGTVRLYLRRRSQRIYVALDKNK